MSTNENVKSKKRDKNVVYAIVHVKATFNNTIIAFTTPQGDVISWSSAGMHGFKGSRKSTPFAAQVCAEHAAKAAQEFGVKTVAVIVRGLGGGRESAIRALVSVGLMVTSIKDETPIAFNGCRPPKRRRV